MDTSPNSESVIAFRQAVAEGVKTADWKAFDRWTITEGTDCGRVANIEDPPLDVGIYDAIASYFDDPAFLSSAGAYNVLYMLEREWGRFSDEQLDALFPRLTNNFLKFTDYMSHFLIAELLGEYYADSAALEALRSIKPFATGTQREVLPMAFEYLVRYSGQESVRIAALAELHAMGQGEEQLILDEVEQSLEKIKTLR